MRNLQELEYFRARGVRELFEFAIDEMRQLSLHARLVVERTVLRLETLERCDRSELGVHDARVW